MYFNLINWLINVLLHGASYPMPGCWLDPSAATTDSDDSRTSAAQQMGAIGCYSFSRTEIRELLITHYQFTELKIELTFALLFGQL